MRFSWLSFHQVFGARYRSTYPPLSDAKADDEEVKVTRRRFILQRLLTPLLVITFLFTIVHRLIAHDKLNDKGSSYAPVPKRIIEEHNRKVEDHRSTSEYVSRKVEKCKNEKASWTKHRVVQGKFNVSGMISKHLVAVSNSIGQSGMWEGEGEDTAEIVNGLEELGPGSTFIDIGAGLGWSTLSAAYSGYRVVAIEADEKQASTLRHSLCLAPSAVRARVTVIPYAVGPHDGGTCSLWRKQGDTVTMCRGVDALSLQNRGYTKVGTAKLRSLDGLQLGVPGPYKTVMKIDVTGYEPFVLYGAVKLLRDVKPKYVFCSFDRKKIEASASSCDWSLHKSRELPDAFLSSMSLAGYDYVISKRDSKGSRQVVFTRA